jgi:ThiF family
MSLQPIALSPCLLRLRNEGYDLDIKSDYLLVKDIPYVDEEATVQRGILIVKLDLSGDIANKPQDHVAYWSGKHPCHSNGQKIRAIENPSPAQDLGDGIRADFTFSAKAEYRDYYHKVMTYVGRIVGEANKINPTVFAATFPAIPENEGKAVFNYVDTATSRSGIGAINGKVANLRIGIIGMGGTGAYLLDLIAKTSVVEIHLFDGDVFSQHNAFRAPGAPSIEELRAKPLKVNFFAAAYSKMRNGIIAHGAYLDEQNVELVDGLDFVFICMDRAAAKRVVVDRLTANGTPFIEVGMGVLVNDGQLTGIVRVVTSTLENQKYSSPHISFADGDGIANEYATNIQIAELNSLNAALAVLRWKQMFGIYRGTRGEYYCGYSISSGEIVSEGTN